jgi:cell division protein FtsB
MKYLLLISLLVGTASVFAQSKKKQIEQLRNQLDSVALVNAILKQANEDLQQDNELLLLQTVEANELQHIVAYELKTAVDQMKKDRLKIIAENAVLDSLREEVSNLKSEIANIQDGEKPKNGVKSSSPAEADPFSFFGSGGGFSESGNGVGSSDGGYEVRKLISNVKMGNIPLARDETIYFTLELSPSGNVLSYKTKGATTTSNQVLIDKVGREIKRQVRYSSINEPRTQKVSYKVYLKVP